MKYLEQYNSRTGGREPGVNRKKLHIWLAIPCLNYLQIPERKAI